MHMSLYSAVIPGPISTVEPPYDALYTLVPAHIEDGRPPHVLRPQRFTARANATKGRVVVFTRTPFRQMGPVSNAPTASTIINGPRTTTFKPHSRPCTQSRAAIFQSETGGGWNTRK